MSFDSDFADPPREFSLMPFWFWNDRLDADELVRQIDAFERNGIYGFVIHPRVGLPRDCGWMSEKLLGFYHVAINEAARRGMHVILYDEGMYPSGSSCGQVVANHPDLACRCLALHDDTNDDGHALPPGAIVVQRFTDAAGRPKLIVDRPADAYIRGLHYLGNGLGTGDAEQDGKEDEPPAGDILNPRTADTIIDLVYGVFAREFSHHFKPVPQSTARFSGPEPDRSAAQNRPATASRADAPAPTILGIFTDEPNPLGKLREKNVFPYTTGILPHLQRLTGQDFAARLHKLWDKADPAADEFRKAYRHAIRLRLEETWYKPLSDWCAANGTSLCGHPDAGDEIGVQRHFQIPGQDLVWRFVEPDKPTALEGPESTQAKCTASAMVHSGRRRNSNEFAGAYGPQTTFAEIQWLANWCLIRGVNLLIPHAFYYSVRGPRRHERPPQIGPHTPQWDMPAFKAWADHCRRVCWLNTDSTPVVDIAVLTHADRCPWHAAKILLQHQRDFHYLDPTTLVEAGRVDGDMLLIGDMRYAAVVIDGDDASPAAVTDLLRPLTASGRVIRIAHTPADEGASDAFIRCIDQHTQPSILTNLSPDLRLRIVKKDGRTIQLAFNEARAAPMQFPAPLATKPSAATPLSAIGGGATADPIAYLGPGQFTIMELPPMS